MFNILDQTSPLVNGVPSFNNVAAAMNPLTNVGVIVNESSGQGLLVDPTVPALSAVRHSTQATPQAVSRSIMAIDPAANTALIIVNQKDTPPTATLFFLGGPLRSPQIIQSSFKPAVSRANLFSCDHQFRPGNSCDRAETDCDPRRKLHRVRPFLASIKMLPRLPRLRVSPRLQTRAGS